MSDTPRTYLPLGGEMIPSNNVGYVTIEDFNAEREKVAELKQALSGRTVSCDACNKMAEENAELRKQLGEAQRTLLEIHAYIVNGTDAFTRQIVTGYLKSNGLVAEDGVTHIDWGDK